MRSGRLSAWRWIASWSDCGRGNSRSGDWREERTAGFKFNEWELKGVPIRLEIGPRDVAAEQVTLVRRDVHGKAAVGLEDLVDRVE